MNTKTIIKILVISALAILITCKKTPTASGDNLLKEKFARFVAIGNSITAGVADGALYQQAQRNSFPVMIARVTDVEDDFEQPLMSDNGYSWKDTDGRLSVNPLTFSISFLESGGEANRDLGRAYNNLGIPLIRTEQLYTVTNSVEADSNHFVDKILRSSGRTPIGDALSQDPTIVTLWVGNNDVLEAATFGLADAEFPYTISTDFNTHLGMAIDQLTGGTDAPVFMANIMDITDLPYFTTLPPYVIDGTSGTKTYLFGECEDGIRELTDDDMVLFWALPDYFAFAGDISSISVTTALNDTLVLDASEKAEIQTLINEYNTFISTHAGSNDQLHLVDMYALFKDIAANGYILGGVNYTTDLITFDENGIMSLNLTQTLYSLDALHTRHYGNAAIANKFIEVMNQKLGLAIRAVGVGDIKLIF